MMVLRVVGVKVRRGKALDFSGCNSRPGTGSFHPMAIGAAVEEADSLGFAVWFRLRSIVLR